jgi:hypothetical protein
LRPKKAAIPPAVITVVSEVLGSRLSHRQIDSYFAEQGVNIEPPSGSRVVKVSEYLKAAEAAPALDSLSVLGGVLTHLLDVDRESWGQDDPWKQGQEQVRAILLKFVSVRRAAS